MSDNVILRDLEILEDVKEFVHEEIDGEELSRFVLEVVGTAVSDLIVEEDGSGVGTREGQVRNG